MASVSFDEGREEIVALLERSKEEYRDRNELVAVSMLIEAQFLINELVQNGIERAEEECVRLIVRSRSLEVKHLRIVHSKASDKEGSELSV